MKLASYKDGSRDGQLVVVSRDLATAHHANGIATRLQQVLDDWNFLSPQLEELSVSLNHGRARHAFPFDPALCMAPLPRAFQRVSAPPDATGGPHLHAASGDNLVGPTDLIVVASEKMGIDFAPEIAVVTGDVAAGTPPDRAVDAVRLVMLGNAVALRHLETAERSTGGGLLQSRPAAAFGPVAVTPDELGDAWRRGRAHLTVQVTWNGRRAASLDAAGGPHAFGELIAHLAATRPVRAGTVVGCGLPGGEARTEFMRFGDTVRIEVKRGDGPPVFGALDQAVATPD